MARKLRFSRASLVAVLLLVPLTVIGSRVPTTLMDFFQPGTQPNGLTDPPLDMYNCANCHGYFDADTEPYTPWSASLMGQASRDPVFLACLNVAEQDAAFVGDLCLRCHSPNGWLGGRSEPTDGSAMSGTDLQGVNCNICHRTVNPQHRVGIDPAVDVDILAGLTNPPATSHNGAYVIDPLDRRRGPFDLTINPPHAWLNSPYHLDSELCTTCHDVSNPAFTRQPDGSYALDALNAPHPTQNRYDEFPVEHTFSEWSMSDFAQPIDMGGRFGGNQPAVSSCQDCHMPKTTGQACYFGEVRTDLPRHYFNGGNTWVLNAVRNLYWDSDTGLEEQSVADSISRAIGMLQAASDMELSVEGDNLRVRTINQTGHKLPSGYPEGRRMWLNVEFFNAAGDTIAERGSYDSDTATLSTDDTMVYEAALGMTPDVAAAVGLPPGESFHFVLNNMYVKDNRIPPRGFSNENFTAIGAAPVGHAYADGQYWDDAQFAIPEGAVRAEARLLYQTTSREYIEFLRDNSNNGSGQIAYDQWVINGKSAPVVMDEGEISLSCPGDLDGDYTVAIGDLAQLLSHFGMTSGAQPGDGDFDGDGDVDLTDLSTLLSLFGTFCP